MSHTVLIALLLAASSALATEYSQHMHTSLSIRPPSRQTRIVEADTLKNPIDYEVSLGFERTKGWAKVWAWTWWERESGFKMTGRDLRTAFGGRHVEAGFHVTDRDDRNLHTAQCHVARKFFSGVFGIGVTRQYYSLWGDAAWLARLSLDYELGKTVKLHGVYSHGRKGNKQLSGQLDIPAIAFGPDDRLRFGPTAKGMLLDGPGGRKTSYQMKLVLSVGL